MVRYRRYRVFLVFAIITIFGIYQFGRGRTWNLPSAVGAGSLKQFGLAPTTPLPEAAADPAVETHKGDQDLSLESVKDAPIVTPTPTPTPQQANLAVQSSKRVLGPSTSSKPQIVQNTPSVDAEEEGDLVNVGEGRVEINTRANIQAVHWTKLPEHFPISSTIQLPTGSPKPIPRIQHKFGSETDKEKGVRQQKLKAIREAAAHAWQGYKEHAWLSDEVSPVSGGKKDPFNGWAASLVDALDTLWIMGMKAEFEEATQAVAKIDFTTSPRRDIPIFETTIRYLGGLVAAYDVSGAKYKILLEKAVELAEVLMGAFDTPNRMPMTYYQWRPTFPSQPHRATTRVVLAEIGSLSMEFTRLAQLTKEPKYYDAIDRITDAFKEWQDREVNGTLVPGMWPTYIDASGCEKPGQMQKSHSLLNGPMPPLPNAHVGAEAKQASDEEKTVSSEKVTQEEILHLGQPGKGRIAHWGDPLEEGSLDDRSQREKLLSGKGVDSMQKKRQLDGPAQGSEVKINQPQENKAIDLQDQTRVTPPSTGSRKEEACIPRGLDSPTKYGSDKFTLGAMSDSLYEYLPKQYLLLGGLEDKYRSMYEKSMDAATKYLLYRPMTPDNLDILMAGEWRAYHEPEELNQGSLLAEGAHLTCFAGGMYAMGAKIFGREEDLDIGAKLTDGCVWAYNSTTTGIMPEQFVAVPCESRLECKWNETKYWDLLDPYQATRTKIPDLQWLAGPAPGMPVKTNAATVSDEYLQVSKEKVVEAGKEVLDMAGAAIGQHKRQIDSEPAVRQLQAGSPVQDSAEPVTSVVPVAPPAYTPPKPLSHEEYVKKTIEQDRLPPGIVKITSRKYILRPEAIESVFYMWRITGEQHWRDVGWEMFTAINAHTWAPYGHSSIDDVTKSAPEQLDGMESFWIAETLKYFYLLFSDPDVISLDDWVLNTEAHPFRRP